MITNKRFDKKLSLFIILTVLMIASCNINKSSINNNNDYYEEKKDDLITIEKVEKYEQTIFSENIKSLKIGTKNITTSEPCYSINSNDYLTINFDLLTENSPTLQYELIHCNINWEKSNLMDMEYIDGFTRNYVENFEISHGPVQQYIHYNFEIPNENLNFIKSGNYLLKVFYENQSQNPLMTIKLFVSEQSSTIKFDLLKSNDMEQRRYIQTYDVNCTYNPQQINDPYSNIYLNIQQNHQQFDEHWISGPNFVRENNLVFINDEDRFFNGSNEFRFFEMSTFRHGSQNVEKIYFEDDTYKIILKKDPKRSYRQYLEYKDLDGRYFTRTYDNEDVKSQGEYGEVKFEMPVREKLEDKIYIFGELSNWTINEKFLMNYDTTSKSYKNSVLLKQGYYNYLYVTKDGDQVSTRKLEGAHFDANNEYIIKVYYKDPLELYDRLLGYQVFKINT